MQFKDPLPWVALPVFFLPTIFSINLRKVLLLFFWNGIQKTKNISFLRLNLRFEEKMHEEVKIMEEKPIGKHSASKNLFQAVFSRAGQTDPGCRWCCHSFGDAD